MYTLFLFFYPGNIRIHERLDIFEDATEHFLAIDTERRALFLDRIHLARH